MNIIVKEIEVKDYLTKSNLPASDYVINPYVGCPHGCKYCYASFMKRFTGHKEEWGTFIDVKRCTKPISKKKGQIMIDDKKIESAKEEIYEDRFLLNGYQGDGRALRFRL